MPKNGANPAVRVHAVLGPAKERKSRRLRKDTTTQLRKLLHELTALATTKKQNFKELRQSKDWVC
jgi:hypothetical protein